jgi:hypothetical protein
MTTFDNSFLQKSSHKFYCANCDYGTSKKSNYAAHNLSTKHYKNNELTTFDNGFKPKISPVHICEFCDKKYKDRAGLWRHKKKCNHCCEKSPKSHAEPITAEPTDKELIMLLLKENSDMKKLVLEVCQKIQPSIITNTNSHNKTFNLNFFLNETCKNAMNIMDFVDSLKLQLNDLERMGEIGFVNGMSNIIIKNLQSMDITERPVHCTDQKREVIYVKDDNKWDKEEDAKPKLRKAIKHIAHKNAKLIGEFKIKHPDYKTCASKISTQYNTMVIEAMGGIGCVDVTNENKIIKRISKEIMVEKE